MGGASEFLFSSVFAQIAALLVLAAAVGLVGHLLRQPLIVSFIAAGLIAGPAGLDLVHAEEEVELLSELGIALLLFLVGLKLDVGLIRSLGGSSVVSGVMQVAATLALGAAVAMSLGFSPLEALYVGIALSFSSTIIIVKLLSDKREIDALHGQLALGFLIVQDIVVVLVMIGLSAIGAAGEAEQNVSTVLLSGAALIVVVAIFVRFAADPFTEFLARVPELMVCFAIALAAVMAALADFGGLGKELGGLLAGVALASTRYREAIGSRLAPLRDFLLLFFFVSLGSEIQLDSLGSNVLAALVFSMVVLVGKPLIVVVILAAMGYRRRTSFLAAITLGQISEFSLILAGLGVATGQLSGDILGAITLVALITIAVSSYMIALDQRIYRWCEPLMSMLERRNPKRESGIAEDAAGGAHEVLLFGLGRYGTAIGLRLRAHGISVLGVDFNPAAVRRWRGFGMDVEYGDAGDPEFVSKLLLDGVKWAISTVPVHETGLVHGDGRLAFIAALRAAGFDGSIVVTSHRESEAQRLRTEGADLVFEPFHDAADRAVELIVEGREPQRVTFDAVPGEFEGR